MSGNGEHYQSLRVMYRISEYRRFRTKHRSNRWAEILGFSPDGKDMLGWFDGSEELVRFDPDDVNWTRQITYV